jgi:hypothetical protein
MKKIIAISVMLVLVAGAVFADVSIGGQFKAGANLIYGSTVKDSEITAGGRTEGNGTEGIVNVGFGDANLGGKVRLLARSSGDYFSPDAFTFAWWKPTESFRIQAGYNPDADWGTAKIGGWGYNAEAQDFVALDEWNGGDTFREGNHLWKMRHTGFYDGFKSNSSIALSFYPSEGLTINIGIPFVAGSMKGLQSQYLESDLQVTYALQDTGVISFTFDGQGAAKKAGTTNEYEVEAPKIFASFYLTAIEGIGVDIGVGFQPKLLNEKTPPIQVGLGFSYRSEDFGVKLRLGAELAGKDALDNEDPMLISVGVLPYYNLGVCTAYLNAGIGMIMPKEGDSTTGWFFNPYVVKGVEGAKLFAGLKVWSNGCKGDKLGATEGDTNVYWGVPIGINVYF